MHYKRYVLAFIIVLALFVSGNYVIWKYATENLITDRHFDGGDLSRMGYILGSKMYRHNTTDLPRRHIGLKDYDGRRVDMITIGDSFSNGGGGGYNRFYQDYIASNNNFEVLNIEPVKGLDFISNIVTMLNNGFIGNSRAGYILIGPTELGWRELSLAIDFNKNISMDELEKMPVMNRYDRLPQVPFINNGNFKFLLFNMLYSVSERAVFSKVYKAKLSKAFFTVPADDQLLYLPFRSFPSVEDMKRMNDNLNNLSDRLAAHGIRLVFAPFPNKYTLYAPWLERKKYAESNFFELLRPLPKRYSFIDTKKLLREELEKGEKDIYYADDTHSSWKASEKIFSSIHFPYELDKRP